MRRSRRFAEPALAAALGLAAVSAAGRERATAVADPLAAEIARWSAYVRDNPSKDATWADVKGAVSTPLSLAEQALAQGRRLLALQRLAPVRQSLIASQYLESRPPAQRKDDAAFEAEWRRVGTDLGGALDAPPPDALAGVSPAAVRAVGEAALPQARVFHAASLDYARNTMPDAGLFYLGSALAARDTAALARSLATTSRQRAPAVRGLAGEIEALQEELLRLYRPPLSVDRHADFILASSLLKEARELDAASLRHGALLRYLQSAQRCAALAAEAPLDEAAIRSRLAEAEGRLAEGDVDHSLGQLFLEAARADLDAPSSVAPRAVASAVVTTVLPRYLEALEPARPRTPAPAPRATVTLVRWPYT